MSGKVSWLAGLVATAACGRVGAPPEETPEIPADCGKVSQLADGFDDAAVARFWLPADSAPITVAETGSELVVTLAPDQAAPMAGGYVSAHQYDLTGSRIFLKVPRVPEPVAGANVFFNVGYDGDNLLEFIVEAGVIKARSTIGGVSAELQSTPYDPVAHLWWEFRETGGTIYLETSPDGSAWNLFAPVATPPFAEYLTVGLGAGTSLPVANPGGATFDSLNTSGAEVAGDAWCSIEDFTDEFEDGALDLGWSSVAGAGCEIGEADGNLSLLPPSAPTARVECLLRRRRAYNLISATTSVELTEVVAGDGTDQWFEVRYDADNAIRFVVAGGNLVARATVAGVDNVLATVPYDAGLHQAVRFRNSRGTTFWESYDGTLWNELTWSRELFPVDRVSMGVGVGVDAGATPVGRARFDALNAM